MVSNHVAGAAAVVGVAGAVVAVVIVAKVLDHLPVAPLAIPMETAQTGLG